MKRAKFLRVSLIQTHLIWEDPKANLIAFDHKLESLYGITNLVVLPEMFTTGFSMNPGNIASDQKIINYLATHAKKGNYAIYGSVMYRDGENYVNRGVFMKPDGSYDTYDKRHTFTLAGEHEVYEKGTQPVISEYLGWKFNLQICYDLRFPVFARNTQGYDVVLYVANWPVPRVSAWDALLRARAIENMSYCIGVNRIGMDGTGMSYNGHSQVYNVLGESLLDHPWENENIRTVKLDYDHIETSRKKLPFLKDADEFKLM